MVNAQIVRDGLVRAIWVFISSDDRLDGQVIDEWIAVARYLVLKNKGHISLISLYHIGISHWDHREMMRTQRTVEGSEVLWIWMKQTLVISSEQVHHTVTILFPHRSILLFTHTQCLLIWRGRRHYINTSYLFIRTLSSFCFFDLSKDLANS